MRAHHSTYVRGPVGRYAKCGYMTKRGAVAKGSTTNEIGREKKLAATIGAAPVAGLQVVQLGFQPLDRAVSLLEVLVETIALLDELCP